MGIQIRFTDVASMVKVVIRNLVRLGAADSYPTLIKALIADLAQGAGKKAGVEMMEFGDDLAEFLQAAGDDEEFVNDMSHVMDAEGAAEAIEKGAMVAVATRGLWNTHAMYWAQGDDPYIADVSNKTYRAFLDKVRAGEYRMIIPAGSGPMIVKGNK